MTGSLTSAERRALLRLARASIEAALRGEGALAQEIGESALTPALTEPRGAFVTLKTRARGEGPPRLRGCIGTLEPDDPLYRTVIRSAAHAALDDPRFAPLAASELTGVRIEISVLTPPEPLFDPETIVAGRDGVDLERGDRRAVFLPQVTIEQGWSRDELLEQLALKAGLPRGGWRDARLRTFRAEVFGEPEEDSSPA